MIKMIKKIKGKKCVCFTMSGFKQFADEMERLQHHEATTVGLWAIDRNPKKVSRKWIKKQAFRITKTDNVL